MKKFIIAGGRIWLRMAQTMLEGLYGYKEDIFVPLMAAAEGVSQVSQEYDDLEGALKGVEDRLESWLTSVAPYDYTPVPEPEPELVVSPEFLKAVDHLDYFLFEEAWNLVMKDAVGVAWHYLGETSTFVVTVLNPTSGRVAVLTLPRSATSAEEAIAWLVRVPLEHAKIFADEARNRAKA